MIAFPNVKINLGLNILSKREDNYYNIDSCFYPVPWCDALEIIPTKKFSFRAYGLPIPGDNANNLCIKAYKLIKEDYDIPPVAIRLLKQIPMGAGLGGGSSDGAFTLKLINELFALRLSNRQLEQYALRLGSDCPFFIRNKPAIVKGRGEELTPIDLDISGHYLAIYNHGIHISSAKAYTAITPKQPVVSIAKILSSPIMQWRSHLQNDFEASIFASHPKIALLKNEMYGAGALYSSMTGSGSTVYGIFENNIDLPVWKVLKLV